MDRQVPDRDEPQRIREAVQGSPLWSQLNPEDRRPTLTLEPMLTGSARGLTVEIADGAARGVGMRGQIPRWLLWDEGQLDTLSAFLLSAAFVVPPPFE